MFIQCTQALLDKIGIKGSDLASPESYEEYPESFMAWHANLIAMGRKKAIVLMNNETRFPVVIYGPVKKDFTNIKALIREAIEEALRMEGVRKDVIDAYFDKAGEIKFSKTANRKMVGKLTNAVRDIEFTEEYINKDMKIQKYISTVTGRLIQSDKKVPFIPIDKTLACLGQLLGLGEDVVDVELFQLKIQMNLRNHQIWRRVLVPSTYSFRHLHNIIQTVFDWQNNHLHEFRGRIDGEKPLTILMDDHPELLEYINLDKVDILQERFVSLENIFPKYDEIVYEYDFGDSWEHVITLEKVVKANEFRAKYLDGEGKRPPEDVGGEGGFEEYLRVMADRDDPMHENMKVWAEEQKEREISEELMNKWLTKVLSGGRYSPGLMF